MKTSLQIPTTDNLLLSAFLFEPKSLPKGVILLCTGMGIPKEFYERYCTFLAEEGYVALVFDYRGMGNFLKKSASNHKEINLRNWAIKDMTSVVNWLKVRYPNQKLYFFGHSVGGQIAGLMENHDLIERFVFFSSTTGHWTVFGFPMNLLTIFMFYLHIPITTRLFGYMPKSLTYRGVGIAKGVAQEWAQWSRKRNYIAAFFDKTLPENYYEAIQQKIEVIWFTDDFIATHRAVSSMLAYYKNADVTQHPMNPKELGLPRMGHGGFFTKRAGKKMWRYPLGLIEG